jgi:hypothetical protein
MKNGKKNGKRVLFIIITIFVVALLPAVGILSYTQYFAWDSQFEGDPYKIALEKDGKLYELNIQGNSLAFDKETSDDQLYLNSPHYLAELIAFSYGNQDVDKTDNPFFAGKISAGNKRKYFEQETKYSTPKDSYQSYKFYDQNRNQIFAYEPETENEYVVKLRPTFPSFSKSRVGIHNKSDYLNATKILKETLNKNLKIKADETNKLLVLSFEN